jgi:hypothetical protein
VRIFFFAISIFKTPDNNKTKKKNSQKEKPEMTLKKAMNVEDV